MLITSKTIIKLLVAVLGLYSIVFTINNHQYVAYQLTTNVGLIYGILGQCAYGAVIILLVYLAVKLVLIMESGLRLDVDVKKNMPAPTHSVMIIDGSDRYANVPRAYPEHTGPINNH